MPGDLDVAVKLSMQGGDQVRAELTALGAAGSASFAEIETRAQTTSTALQQSVQTVGAAAEEMVEKTSGTVEATSGQIETWTNEVASFSQSSLQSIGSTLQDFTVHGRADWRAMVEGMAADFAQLVYQVSVLRPLERAARTSLPGLLGSLFHDGGPVEAGAPAGRTRVVPADLFAAAPRLHDGTLPGLAPDEVPAILQTGEMVLNRRQASAVRSAQDDPLPDIAPSGTNAALLRGGDTYVLQVDARGPDSDGDAGVEARVERAVAIALAQQVPGIIRASADIAQRRVVDDYRRRGGRFG